MGKGYLVYILFLEFVYQVGEVVVKVLVEGWDKYEIMMLKVE